MESLQSYFDTSALIGCPKYEVIDIWKKSLNSPKVYIEEPNIFFHFIFHQTKQLITLYVYNLFLFKDLKEKLSYFCLFLIL